ncbi:MAG TPA: DinB family protein [Kouleothrix sp.]|uniref:DinB family protein n=1 Tax=Kouleothrix sp. TaxID=2779161 RepID=UPI002BD38538|nr:DinB family protein [Kouleothrix sp.]
MLDFTPVRKREKTMLQLAEGLTLDDLRRLTNEMIDTMLGYIAESTDADVQAPIPDPDANDTFASNPDDVLISWTLGHVIVHTTASAEESAALAAELARGVEFHGRSRSEVPWEQVTTIAQCRARLEESRRMRLASLDMWPDEPHLANSYEPYAGVGQYNAVARFIGGLSHDDAHLGQIERLAREARALRS